MDTHSLLGSAVESLAGRDKDRIYVVVGIVDENYVLIADGKVRRIETPKRKKVKHIKRCFHSENSDDVRISVEDITNKQLREFIAKLTEEKDG